MKGTRAKVEAHQPRAPNARPSVRHSPAGLKKRPGQAPNLRASSHSRYVLSAGAATSRKSPHSRSKLVDGGAGRFARKCSRRLSAAFRQLPVDWRQHTRTAAARGEDRIKLVEPGVRRTPGRGPRGSSAASKHRPRRRRRPHLNQRRYTFGIDVIEINLTSTSNAPRGREGHVVQTQSAQTSSDARMTRGSAFSSDGLHLMSSPDPSRRVVWHAPEC